MGLILRGGKSWGSHHFLVKYYNYKIYSSSYSRAPLVVTGHSWEDYGIYTMFPAESECLDAVMGKGYCKHCRV